VRGKNHPRLIEYWIWGGGFVLSVVVLILLGRISLRLLKEAQEKVAAEKDKAQRLERQEISTRTSWAHK